MLLWIWFFSHLPLESVKTEEVKDRTAFQTHLLPHRATASWIETQRGERWWKCRVYILHTGSYFWIFDFSDKNIPPKSFHSTSSSSSSSTCFSVSSRQMLLWYIVLHVCCFPGNRKQRIRWISEQGETVSFPSHVSHQMWLTLTTVYNHCSFTFLSTNDTSSLQSSILCCMFFVAHFVARTAAW